jgi:hypothetical protein
MHQDVGTINQVVHNLELFYDLEVMLGFSCIMSMLEGLNELIKFPNLGSVLYVILFLQSSCVSNFLLLVPYP